MTLLLPDSCLCLCLLDLKQGRPPRIRRAEAQKAPLLMNGDPRGGSQLPAGPQELAWPRHLLAEPGLLSGRRNLGTK